MTDRNSRCGRKLPHFPGRRTLTGLLRVGGLVTLFVAVTFESVRKLALAFPGVEEGCCHGTPAFYVRQKLILRLWEDGETLVARCAQEKRAELIRGNPDVFFCTEHYQNYPAVLVNLLAVKRDTLRETIEAAWRMRASKKLITQFEKSEANQGGK